MHSSFKDIKQLLTTKKQPSTKFISTPSPQYKPRNLYPTSTPMEVKVPPQIN
jgi:hypothetical protein